MKPIIGIDLGTTFSAIAVLDESGTSNIISVDGERIMASCISAPSEERGTLFVGNPARADLETEPEMSCNISNVTWVKIRPTN